MRGEPSAGRAVVTRACMASRMWSGSSGQAAMIRESCGSTATAGVTRAAAVPGSEVQLGVQLNFRGGSKSLPDKLVASELHRS